MAFDAGAVPEVAGAGALTVTDGDLPALMRATQRVGDGTSSTPACAPEGLEHAKRYSWTPHGGADLGRLRARGRRALFFF